MALVAYGSSDSEAEDNISDNEESEQNAGKVIILEKKEEDTSKSDLFTSLPKPQHNANEVIEEENDEFLTYKEVAVEKPKKQPVRISIPTLADFIEDDGDEPVKKKPKPADKAPGLFALLPAPKMQPTTTKHFVPNSVKRNTAPKPKPKQVKKPEVQKPVIEKVKEVLSSDDEDLKELPETYDDETWQKVCGRPKQKRRPIIEEPTTTNQVIEIAPEPVKPYTGLDNAAFKELLGANSKRKGESVNVVDINEDEILPDKEVWMTKSLTDPEFAPKYVVKDPVNDTCKRKHHITYLAQQAKANEQDLQNQWAANKFTRQKTQAKYGF